ncbi:MAG: hypothetical protein LC674_02010, partial [Actinobacteria bacterium]|nr:hypothetical protein [Actinomycetota bacterium]
MRVISRIYTGQLTETSELAELEKAIRFYFEGLQLPEEPTVFDYIVLSLKKKDLIATFNWDPLLVQAIRRNAARTDIPRLSFLHGNVALGFCAKDNFTGHKGGRCGECGQAFEPVKLLYPIKQKDYASDPYISGEWQAFRHYLNRAAFLTVFGYGAPKSDVEAMDAIQDAWGTASERSMEQIEIIDLRKEDELKPAWDTLIHTHHYE